MRNTLGIYFGPKIIGLVDRRGKKILNYLQIQRTVLAAAELEEKVPDEVKMVALFKEELRKSRIEAKEAAFSLAGKDLIIRTFEIPVLPTDELPNAINFEVKKYLPFKVEDLIADFQITMDKVNHRYQVLYVGIKKETLDKYLSIVNQLNLKINTLEYCAFSVFRLLKLINLGNKGIVGVINMDISEEDEVNFLILENGFVLFNRDISLTERSEEFPETQEVTSKVILEKIKTEIRLSLDYYRRRFSFKKLTKIILLGNEEYSGDFEAFFKEMDLPMQFVDTTKLIPRRQFPFSLGLLKAYGASLSDVVRTPIKINLLEAKVRLKTLKERVETGIEMGALLSHLSVNLRFVFLGFLICLFTFGFSLYRKFPVQQELNTILSARPEVVSVNSAARLDELANIEKEYTSKIEKLNNLITQQMYFTPILETIPRILPEQMRLTNLSYTRRDENRAELRLQGIVYLGDANKELKLINAFVSMLKENEVLKKYFPEIGIANIELRQMEKVTVTDFTIYCKS